VRELFSTSGVTAAAKPEKGERDRAQAGGEGKADFLLSWEPNVECGARSQDLEIMT